MKDGVGYLADATTRPEFRGQGFQSALLLRWHGGLLLALCALVLIMTNYPNLQHTRSFYLISGAVYPALYQALRVSPSELSRETPYIQRNMTATVAAIADSTASGASFIT